MFKRWKALMSTAGSSNSSALPALIDRLDQNYGIEFSEDEFLLVLGAITHVKDRIKPGGLKDALTEAYHHGATQHAAAVLQYNIELKGAAWEVVLQTLTQMESAANTEGARAVALLRKHISSGIASIVGLRGR